MSASTAASRLRSLPVWGTQSGLVRLAERAHVTPTGLVVVGLVLGGWFAARAVGGRTMYLMVYASALALIMSWFLSRRRLAVDMERSELPARVRAGQPVAVELRAVARRRLTTVVLEEELPPVLGPPVRLAVGALSSGGELHHRYTFTPARRGVYRFGPTTATWSDPFGLTTHAQLLLEAADIIVHPQTEGALDRVLTRMWEDPPVRPPVSKPWPVGFEFYGMRDYVPGDDLRRVVWTAYAKTGRLLVRESEQGITDRVVIYIDTDREWHSPGDVSETFETAVKTAASVGVRHLEDGFSVTLVTNDGYAENGLRGARAHLALLDRLARLEMTATKAAAVGQILLDEARVRSHLLVITPHLDTAAAQRLKLVIDRGISVVVAKVLWEETDPTSLARAASVGCQIVQIPPGASLAAVFANAVSTGVRG